MHQISIPKKYRRKQRKRLSAWITVRHCGTADVEGVCQPVALAVMSLWSSSLEQPEVCFGAEKLVYDAGMYHIFLCIFRISFSRFCVYTTHTKMTRHLFLFPVSKENRCAKEEKQNRVKELFPTAAIHYCDPFPCRSGSRERNADCAMLKLYF